MKNRYSVPSEDGIQSRNLVERHLLVSRLFGNIHFFFQLDKNSLKFFVFFCKNLPTESGACLLLQAIIVHM